MKQFAAALVAASVVLLSACTPLSGTVVSKEYHESTVRTECGMKYGLNPSTGKIDLHYSCHTVGESECYQITLQTPENETRHRCIDKEEWDTLSPGDEWSSE